MMTSEAERGGLEMNMASKLLPCPFCGRSPNMKTRMASDGEFYGHDRWSKTLTFISCMCGGYSARAHQYGPSEAEAISRWNTRTPPASVDEAAAEQRLLEIAKIAAECTNGVNVNGEYLALASALVRIAAIAALKGTAS